MPLITAKYRRRAPIAALIGVLGMLALAPAGAQAAGSESDYIVLYKSGANLTQKVQSEEARGNDVQDVFRSAVKGFLAPLDAADVTRLRARSDVLLVEKDKPVETLSAGPRSGLAYSWGLDRIDQRTLPFNTHISTSQNGFGVTAYIIDTGIRADHEEFGGRVTAGFDAIGDGQNSNDCHGHGTHVAGTVGGKTYGVAPQVSLVAVRVLNCFGSGTVSGVIAGLDWVASDHLAGVPAVVNMSLGAGYSAALNTATENTIADGISISVAAGNANANACNYSPASTPNAITVGSITSGDNRSSFSNVGSCLDLFAPGSWIISAWKDSPTDTKNISGTSMASPHAAGAAALILSGSPSSTPEQVAGVLTKAATTGVVIRPGTGSTNRLLFTGEASVPQPPPVLQPPPPTPPVNDNFSDSITLSSLEVVSGTTVAATHEAGEPSHVNPRLGSSASIWYSWTAPDDGTLKLDTEGSNYDTLLAVYSGETVGSLTLKDSNHDVLGDGNPFWSQVWFNVTAGTVYRIAIDGFDRQYGATRLSVAFKAGPPLNKLTSDRYGTGHGLVTSNPSGINCGMTCSNMLSPSSSVTLTATPSAGSEFVGWNTGTNQCSDTISTCTVSMSKSRTVWAEFYKLPEKSFLLEIVKSGTGQGKVTSFRAGIDCGDDCSEIVPDGRLIWLSAQPENNSAFVGWSDSSREKFDNCSGLTLCQVTMIQARTVTAKFTDFSPKQFDLTVSKFGTGQGTVTSLPAGIDCGSDCSETLSDGTLVRLTAVPAVGSTFAGWNDSWSHCSGLESCHVTMGEARAVTVEFTKPSSDLFTISPVKIGVNSVTTVAVIPGPDNLTQIVTRLGNRGSQLTRIGVCKTGLKIIQAGTVQLTCKFKAATHKALARRSLLIRINTTFTTTDGRSVSNIQLIKLPRRL